MQVGDPEVQGAQVEEIGRMRRGAAGEFLLVLSWSLNDTARNRDYVKFHIKV